MKYEVESKYHVADLDTLAERLRQMGATLADPIEQVDRYYAHPVRDFASTDEALRLRRVGAKNRITYKGPKLDQSTKTRREIELPLGDGDACEQGFAELLSALGFHPVREVCKQRREAHVAWQGQTVIAALDDVAGLGSFIELELNADESTLDAARQTIADLAAHLGLQRSERRSYLEMLIDN